MLAKPSSAASRTGPRMLEVELKSFAAEPLSDRSESEMSVVALMMVVPNPESPAAAGRRTLDVVHRGQPKRLHCC